MTRSLVASRYFDALLFATLAAVWGGSFVAIEVGLDYYPPVLYAAYRFDLAAVLLLSYVFVATERPVPRTRADWSGVAVSGVLIVAANNALLFIGQQFTTSGIAAVVYSLVPITTAAAAGLLIGGADIDARGYVGVLLGFLGVGMVAQPDPANLTAGVTAGVALIFVGVLCVSVGSVFLRRLETTCPAVTLTAWAMLFGGLTIHASSLALGEPLLFPATEVVPLVALAFLGVFASAAGYTLYFTLIERVGPFQSNLVSYVVPMLATVAGWAMLGEPITPTTVAGFLVIVAGFALLKRRTIAAELPRVRARLRR